MVETNRDVNINVVYERNELLNTCVLVLKNKFHSLSLIGTHDGKRDADDGIFEI